jgi:hypothetical protein
MDIVGIVNAAVEATKSAQQAYKFNPGSYTYAALLACREVERLLGIEPCDEE